jgi:hypothetical protein
MNEVTEELRKLNNADLNDLYSSPNIIRVIKSKRMGWACSKWGERYVHTRFYGGTWGKETTFENPGVDGRTILRRIFRKWDGGT